MKKTTTQWVWLDCLQMKPWIPFEFRRATDPYCWLCGGETGCHGWPFKKIIGSAFTDFNAAQAPQSKTICGSCAALMKKELWEKACERHGHDPYFPVKDGKKPFMANWMFSSHVFSSDGWVRPNRAEAREFLISPPTPPFVITLAEAGKKHVIFRARINQSRRRFSVQMDEDELLVEHDKFMQCLKDFEEGYNAGFSKDSLVTGRYNQKAILNVGLDFWRMLEDKMQHWRKASPDLMRLCNFCAQKESA